MSYRLLATGAFVCALALLGYAGQAEATTKLMLNGASDLVILAQDEENAEVQNLLEPETDDNLITWGYTDNVLRVRPSSVEEAMAELLGDTDPSSLTPDQRAQAEKRAQQVMNERQRVPMMRVVTEQPKALMEVDRFTELNRTRYWR